MRAMTGSLMVAGVILLIAGNTVSAQDAAASAGSSGTTTGITEMPVNYMGLLPPTQPSTVSSAADTSVTFPATSSGQGRLPDGLAMWNQGDALPPQSVAPQTAMITAPPAEYFVVQYWHGTRISINGSFRETIEPRQAEFRSQGIWVIDSSYTANVGGNLIGVTRADIWQWTPVSSSLDLNSARLQARAVVARGYSSQIVRYSMAAPSWVDAYLQVHPATYTASVVAPESPMVGVQDITAHRNAE